MLEEEIYLNSRIFFCRTSGLCHTRSQRIPLNDVLCLFPQNSPHRAIWQPSFVGKRKEIMRFNRVLILYLSQRNNSLTATNMWRSYLRLFVCCILYINAMAFCYSSNKYVFRGFIFFVAFSKGIRFIHGSVRSCQIITKRCMVLL